MVRKAATLVLEHEQIKVFHPLQRPDSDQVPAAWLEDKLSVVLLCLKSLRLIMPPSAQDTRLRKVLEESYRCVVQVGLLQGFQISFLELGGF